MTVGGALQLMPDLGLLKYSGKAVQVRNADVKTLGYVPTLPLSSCAQRQHASNHLLFGGKHWPLCFVQHRHDLFTCRYSEIQNSVKSISFVKDASLALTRSSNFLFGNPPTLQLVTAVGIIAFSLWGLVPLMRIIRKLFVRNDSNWKKSTTHYVVTSYVQPLLLWSGAMLISRSLDPMSLPTEASQVVKQRMVNFVKSLSTVLAFAYCLSSFIQQTQKFFTETSNTNDARNMGYQFAGKAVYTAVWIAAISLFMELLGFPTQKWITAGGLGTVFLTLAGREIFTNFLSSIMIHATRPFIINDWVQTKIDGYEVSGTVEHMGWWSPTIIRGDDREAVHIPNHKFTVTIVRNLSQKAHWRIKTHLAISHMDANKINIIVADMRKVLAKNPQVEHKRLHRRVFLDNIDPENQALLILISCFVRTSHFEEYLRVKETVLLDLLKVISHHRARLATPIRTVQKIYGDPDIENIPFSDSIFHRAGVSNRPLLLGLPSRINGEDKPKSRQTQRGVSEGQPMKLTAPSEHKVAPVSDGTAQNKPEKKQVKANSEVAPTRSSRRTDSTISNTSTSASPLSSPSAPQNKSDSVKDGEEMALGATSSGKKTSALEANGETSNGNSTVHARNEAEVSSQVSQTAALKPSLKDNLVLNVALKGSKETLPIDNGLPKQVSAKQKN